MSELTPEEIDALRFRAFKTNNANDVSAYYRAASSYFQARFERAMDRPDPAAIYAEALEDAAKRAEHFASHYSQGSDGRNTFTILADVTRNMPNKYEVK